jgi:hypothetical protein
MMRSNRGLSFGRDYLDMSSVPTIICQIGDKSRRLSIIFDVDYLFSVVLWPLLDFVSWHESGEKYLKNLDGMRNREIPPLLLLSA